MPYAIGIDLRPSRGTFVVIKISAFGGEGV